MERRAAQLAAARIAAAHEAADLVAADPLEQLRRRDEVIAELRSTITVLQRRLAEPLADDRYDPHTVTRRHAAPPVDTRPPPSLTGYDDLLRRDPRAAGA